MRRSNERTLLDISRLSVVAKSSIEQVPIRRLRKFMYVYVKR